MKIYVHHKGQFLDLNGRMGIKVVFVVYISYFPYFYSYLLDFSKHKDPDAAELALCENVGPVPEVPGDWIQV